MITDQWVTTGSLLVLTAICLYLLWALNTRSAKTSTQSGRTSDPRLIVVEAAKRMVEITDHDVLLRLIARYMEEAVNVSQIGLFFWDDEVEKYRLTVQRGRFKAPKDHDQFGLENPLVDWFQHRQSVLFPDQRSLLYADLIKTMREDLSFHEGRGNLATLRLVKNEMDSYQCQYMIPCYYKHRLLAIVMLGAKQDGTRYTQEELDALETLSNIAAMGIRNSQLVEKHRRTNEELKKGIEEVETLRKRDMDQFYQTIVTLAEAVNAKDQYTHSHLEEVEALGQKVAERIYQIKGVPFDYAKRHILSTALKLHDLGKVGTPDHILKKKGSLTNEEWVTMRLHPEVGARILSPIPTLREVAYIIRHHHENYDGSGYPGHLKGEEIPLEARIISVVDTYHAIVSTRPYRKGQPMEIAIEVLRSMAGKQFDPEVVDVFVDVVKNQAA
ncbi:MAG: HD domain-containing protein [Candidatus Omnitrophica bacterium]|nr:HD domain-containing protein [Candidatus Omnitrophota bacterium]